MHEKILPAKRLHDICLGNDVLRNIGFKKSFSDNLCEYFRKLLKPVHTGEV